MQARREGAGALSLVPLASVVRGNGTELGLVDLSHFQKVEGKEKHHPLPFIPARQYRTLNPFLMCLCIPPPQQTGAAGVPEGAGGSRRARVRAPRAQGRLSPPSAVGWGCRGLHGAKADASLRRGLAAKSARGDEYLGWAQVGLGTRKGSWLGGTLGNKPAPGVSVAQWFPLGMGLCVSLCSEVSAPFSHFAGFSQPSDLPFPLSPGTARRGAPSQRGEAPQSGIILAARRWALPGCQVFPERREGEPLGSAGLGGGTTGRLGRNLASLLA